MEILLMIQKLPDLYMYVEVIGCPTTCQHCWAVGRPYQAIPLEDMDWVLHEVRRFCDAHDLTVDGYPMHEVAAHPQASQVMRLFHDLWNLVEEPVPTTGVRLARVSRDPALPGNVDAVVRLTRCRRCPRQCRAAQGCVP